MGRHTGIVADLSSGSVLSVWEGREKELMNRPYIVESNHENKECEGPARGSPSGERYHLKKKKSTNHRPERGSNPGHEGPWSYYLPITPLYLTTTKNGLCIKPGPVKGLGGIALLIILHKVIKNGLSIEPGPVKGLGGIALLITPHHQKKKKKKKIPPVP